MLCDSLALWFLLNTILGPLSVFSIYISVYNTQLDDIIENSRSLALLSESCNHCPDGIQCVPQIQCPAHVRLQNQNKPQRCDLNGGQVGFCCITGQKHTVHAEKVRSLSFPKLSIPVVEEARKKVAVLLRNTNDLSVPRGHPSFFHSIAFHSNLQEDIENFQISASAMEEIITAQIFSEKENIPMDEFEANALSVDFQSSTLGHHCQQPPLCSSHSSKYRTFDGKCNNISPYKSLWGAAGQPLERILPPAFEDGIWSPRAHSIDGSTLPSAREVSRVLMADANRPHPEYNLLLMQFGQFLAHDITQTESVRLENGKPIECCLMDGSDIQPSQSRHFACMPIVVEPHDEFYGPFHQRCLNFVRLSLSPNTNCKMSYARQRSKVTHFIDASPVYGSSYQSAKSLRSFWGGRLQMFDDFGRDLLPLTNEKETCGSVNRNKICFKSGDGRTNQIISLVALQIIFAREHNRICLVLSQLNPQYSDEILYQEARKIVIAELQHIVYSEYLPLIIGYTRMKSFGLKVQQTGFAKGYNININPAVTSEFAGAAFRFGHSTVDGKFHLNSNNDIDEVLNIPDIMFNPARIRKRNFLDRILNTMLKQPMQQVDGLISYGLSRFLFRGENPFGLDLAALNIQRGRDLALRGYNDYREVTGRKRILSFDYFPKDLAEKLSLLYRHPDDIDLWVGGLLEPHAHDSIVGSTFNEIIADQFSRLKRGDRYFYEYDRSINPNAFSAAQLNEIRKSTMARIVCDNSDSIEMTYISRSAFILPHIKRNPRLSCTDENIPNVDLRHWKI